jgi:hypothetical protein
MRIQRRDVYHPAGVGPHRRPGRTRRPSHRPPRERGPPRRLYAPPPTPEQPRHASTPRLADKVARVPHERTGIRTSAASTPGAITLGRRSSDEFRNAVGLRSARLFGPSRWETHL